MIFLTREGAIKTIDAIPTTGLLVAPFVLPANPDWCTKFADLTLSPVNGFAPQAVNFNSPFAIGCEAKITSVPNVFHAVTLSGLPTTIAGWVYYWNILLVNYTFAINLLDSPEVIAQIGDGFTAQLCLALGGGGKDSCCG